MKYFLIAGEASGDLHASHLMQAILQHDPQAEFRYFGGDAMAAVGGTLLLHYREMAYMGVITVIRNIRPILRNMKLCKAAIREFNPDVVIPVDYPGFNLKIAQFVKEELHKPVYYYISPKIWAWKESRIKLIRRYVDRVFSILPFEVAYFQQRHNYAVDYVGNPSLDEIDSYLRQPNVEAMRIQRDKPIIALLCGSRRQEIRDNLPQMLEAVATYPDYHPVIAGAPGIAPEFYTQFIGNHSVEILFGQTFPLLHSAHAALVTSGTATLEAALFNTPQAVAYSIPGGKWVYKAYRLFLKVYWVSLVNLIADREVVRELLGHQATAESLRDELGRLINDESYRQTMREGYAEVHRRLGPPGAPLHAARMMVESLRAK